MQRPWLGVFTQRSARRRSATRLVLRPHAFVCLTGQKNMADSSMDVESVPAAEDQAGEMAQILRENPMRENQTW